MASNRSRNGHSAIRPDRWAIRLKWYSRPITGRIERPRSRWTKAGPNSARPGQQASNVVSTSRLALAPSAGNRPVSWRDRTPDRHTRIASPSREGKAAAKGRTASSGMCLVRSRNVRRTSFGRARPVTHSRADKVTGAMLTAGSDTGNWTKTPGRQGSGVVPVRAGASNSNRMRSITLKGSLATDHRRANLPMPAHTGRRVREGARERAGFRPARILRPASPTPMMKSMGRPERSPRSSK